MVIKKKVAKAVTKHLKEDNKECRKEIKEHSTLIKKIKSTKKKPVAKKK